MSFSKLFYRLTIAIFFIIVASFITIIANLNQSGVSFEVFNYKIYTTSGFVLVLFSLLCYASLRGIFVALRLKHVLEIRKIRYQYRQTLYKTKKQNIAVELSKSLRNFGGKNFISTFVCDLSIENIPYYKLYTKNMSSFRKLITAKKIYKNKENNSTAAIIYAMALRDSGKYQQAKQLLCDFVENKSLEIQNTRSMYAMCVIIVECEKQLTNETNFVKKYIDYIKHYDKSSN